MLLLGTSIAGAQHYDRGYDTAPSTPFVKKGSWMAGGTLRYSQHINDNYSFLVINGIDSKGYGISVNPELLYMFKDNMGVGLRFSYDRNMLDLQSADLSFSEISMSARNCYRIQHCYSGYLVPWSEATVRNTPWNWLSTRALRSSLPKGSPWK